MIWLATHLGPAVIGALFLWYAPRVRGRNGRTAVRCFGWGFLLTLLYFLPIAVIPLPFMGWLNALLRLIPAAISFALGFRSIAREARAQQSGEFTDAA